MSKVFWVVAIWPLAFCASAFCQTVPPTVASPQPKLTEADKSIIANTVKQCVDQVHADKSEPDLKIFFEKFDAFFNLASERVENNAYRAGDQRALYVFKKCMNARGVPIN